MSDGNDLHLDLEVYPYGSTVSIEDLETEDVPGVPAGAKVDVWCYASNHSIDVYTMSYDETDAADRAVRVRVYSGADPSGLGSMVFDGPLELASGILAIRDDIDPPAEDQQLQLGPGSVHLQIFTVRAIETVHYNQPEPGDHPVSGPSDINVLIRRDLATAPHSDT